MTLIAAFTVLIQRSLQGVEYYKPSVCPTKDRVNPERSLGIAIQGNQEEIATPLDGGSPRIKSGSKPMTLIVAFTVLIQRSLRGVECNKPSVCPTKDRVNPERSLGIAIHGNQEEIATPHARYLSHLKRNAGIDLNRKAER